MASFSEISAVNLIVGGKRFIVSVTEMFDFLSVELMSHRKNIISSMLTFPLKWFVTALVLALCFDGCHVNIGKGKYHFCADSFSMNY